MLDFVAGVVIVGVVSGLVVTGMQELMSNDCRFAGLTLDRQSEIDDLNEIMDNMVKLEEYEKAAIIRDRIKMLQLDY